MGGIVKDWETLGDKSTGRGREPKEETIEAPTDAKWWLRRSAMSRGSTIETESEELFNFSSGMQAGARDDL